MFCYNSSAMFRFLGLCFGTLLRFFRSQQSLLLENLALRQQLVVLKRRHPRPKLDLFDRFFWPLLRRCWSGWKQPGPRTLPLTISRLRLMVNSPMPKTTSRGSKQTNEGLKRVPSCPQLSNCNRSLRTNPEYPVVSTARLTKWREELVNPLTL
jgi:hypothetical protein